MHPRDPPVVVIAVISPSPSPCHRDHKGYKNREQEEERDSDPKTQDKVHVVVCREGPEMNIVKHESVLVTYSFYLTILTWYY